MNRVAAIFLQLNVVLIGIVLLGLLLLEPQLEGRNANATQFEIYFNDPFLAYIYLAFVPVFVALYQAFRIAGNAGRNELFSEASVRAVRIIKYCASITAIFFVGAVAYIMTFVREEDIAGGVAMGIVIIFACAVVAFTAAVFERILIKRMSSANRI